MTDTAKPETNGHGDPDNIARLWNIAKTLTAGADELRARISSGDYTGPVAELQAELDELDEDAEAATVAAINAQNGYDQPPPPPDTDEATTAAFDALNAAALAKAARDQAELAAYERRITLAERGVVNLADFLTEQAPEHSWLIPGLLEHGDRTILTGAEGRGKSTLLRQIGVQCAAGVHPFTLDPIAPLTVALFDLENSRNHVRRKLRPLALTAPDLDQGRLWPIVWPSGIDLLERNDRELFTAVLDAIEPDVVIIGPIYKLAGGDPTSEEVARKVVNLLDHLRAAHGFAIILEAHQPYAASGKTARAERPYGASLWSRWPEFGLHLAETGALRHWRGDRDEREWPALLERGGAWPWTVAGPSPTAGPTYSEHFTNLLAALLDVGVDASNRTLARHLGISEPTVRRTIEANRGEWEAARDQLAKAPDLFE